MLHRARVMQNPDLSPECVELLAQLSLSVPASTLHFAFREVLADLLPPEATHYLGKDTAHYRRELLKQLMHQVSWPACCVPHCTLSAMLPNTLSAQFRISSSSGDPCQARRGRNVKGSGAWLSLWGVCVCSGAGACSGSLLPEGRAAAPGRGAAALLGRTRHADRDSRRAYAPRPLPPDGIDPDKCFVERCVGHHWLCQVEEGGKGAC